MHRLMDYDVIHEARHRGAPRPLGVSMCNSFALRGHPMSSGAEKTRVASGLGLARKILLFFFSFFGAMRMARASVSVVLTTTSRDHPCPGSN